MAIIVNNAMDAYSYQRVLELEALLRRIRQANIIFPSMCANNMEAYNLLDEIDRTLSRKPQPNEGDK